MPDPMADMAPDLTPYRYCFNNPVNFIDPYGLYEYDANGNLTLRDPNEISSFINAFGKNWMQSSIDNMSNYITQNFGLDLPEVTVKGENDMAYLDAGRKVSKYQRAALKKARLDGSVFYRVDVFTSDIFNGSEAATLPGIGIFMNKDHLTDLDLLMHEYGHILQAKKYGMLYFYKTIVPTSLSSANQNNTNTENTFYHHDTWTEWSANDLSNDYFKPNKWDMTRFPLLPKHFRSGIYPPMKPSKFYSGQ